MVLECPSPCKDVDELLESKGGKLDEELAKVIMWQATWAAYMCCKRGVFHRDIKPQNLLIKPDTLEVKLIDFGCGNILKTAAYKNFMGMLHHLRQRYSESLRMMHEICFPLGTYAYFCPEYLELGEYHAEPATVWSLGIMLYEMVFGRLPKLFDHRRMRKKKWYQAGVSKGESSSGKL